MGFLIIVKEWYIISDLYSFLFSNWQEVEGPYKLISYLAIYNWWRKCKKPKKRGKSESRGWGRGRGREGGGLMLSSWTIARFDQQHKFCFFLLCNLILYVGKISLNLIGFLSGYHVSNTRIYHRLAKIEKGLNHLSHKNINVHLVSSQKIYLIEFSDEVKNLESYWSKT